MSKSEISPEVSKLREPPVPGDQLQATSNIDTAEVKCPPACDHQHPHNWPSWRKYLAIGVVSFGEMIVPSASMMLAPTLPQVMITFRLSQDEEKLASFSVTVYMIGMAVGMLVFGPMSDLHGRVIPTRVAAYLYTLCSVLCALSGSIDWLIAARAAAGLAGAAPMVIGGSLVADLFPPGLRDTAMTFYVAGPVLGPIIGSIVGGLINESLGWRWNFWIISILSLVYAVLCTVSLCETHYPIIQRRLSNKDATSSQSIKDERRKKNFIIRLFKATKYICKTIIIPARIALFPAITLLMVFFIAYSGFFNILIASLGTVYQRYYRFSESTAGFGYIAIGMGIILGLLFAGNITKVLVTLMPESSSGKRHKNYLLALVISASIICIGWVLYGWACEEQLHWAVSMAGLFLYGTAGAAIKTSSNLFLIEAVPGWSSSTLAAMATTNSIGAAIIPLATFPIYDAVGIGWSYTIMSLILLFLCSIPLYLYLFAESLSGQWGIVLELV